FRMTEPALRIVDVSRQFGGVAALTRVSLEIAEGTIYGLIGPNGAGKTTLFNLINGIYAVSAGRILVGGQDVTNWRPPAVARAGRRLQRGREPRADRRYPADPRPRRHRAAHRARHVGRHGRLRAHRRAELRRTDRRGHAGGDPGQSRRGRGISWSRRRRRPAQ